MKKILSYLLCLSLLFAPYPAIAIVTSDDAKVVYSGTAAVRISAVDGTAFVDNLVISALPQNGKVVAGPTSIAAGAALLDTTTANAFYGGAIDLTAYQTGNYALRLRNTVGGGTATAYISATAPSGEALAADLLSGFDFTSGWNKWQGIETIIDANSFSTSATNQGISKSVLTASRLYKLSMSFDAGTGVTSLKDGFDATTYLSGADTKYKTATGATLYIRTNTTLGTVNVATFTAEQVTMPAATGALLLSTKAGSRGFYRKDSTFDPNAAMTLEVIDISLTAFTDGNHSIELYPATTPSGRMMRGVTKAVGTSESLDAEIATGTCVIKKLYKITATEANHYGTGLIVGSYFTSLGTETNDANNKVKQVLAGGTTASTIVSAKAGATYNWAANTFIAADYNQASYYVVVKKIRGEVIVDTKTIDTGLALIDSTTANAFAAPLVSAAAYDFAAYQDGKHRLDIYSSAGVLWAQGYISSTAPSGEAESAEKITGWTNDVVGPFETLTVNANGRDLDSVINSSGSGNASTNGLVVLGALVKINRVVTGTGISQYWAPGSTRNFGAGNLSNVYHTANQTTGTAITTIYIGGGACNFSQTTSVLQVTMPAATGALLLSTPGGSRGYLFKHASFNPNATGLVFKVVKVID